MHYASPLRPMPCLHARPSAFPRQSAEATKSVCACVPQCVQDLRAYCRAMRARWSRRSSALRERDNDAACLFVAWRRRARRHACRTPPAFAYDDESRRRCLTRYVHVIGATLLPATPSLPAAAFAFHVCALFPRIPAPFTVCTRWRTILRTFVTRRYYARDVAQNGDAARRDALQRAEAQMPFSTRCC